MNKYSIMIKALDEWEITKEVAWDKGTKSVVFLTDESLDLSKVNADDVVYYSKFSEWARMFMGCI
jgi:hypothetical protein